MSKKDDFLLTMPTMSDDVEVIAKPIAKEYTDEEIEKMRSELTFYGSSKWRKMNKEWRDEHPLKEKALSIEEKSRADYEIKMLNEEWRIIQKNKQATKSASAARIEELWIIHDNKMDAERPNIKQILGPKTKHIKRIKHAKPK